MAEARGRGDAAERLRRHWDGVVRGAVAPDGLDPALAETVRRLHALDETPGPSRATVDRIWGELMGDAGIPTGPVGATLGVAKAPNGRVPHPVPATVADAGRRRPSPVAELATAAIVVLSVALGVLSFRLVEREPGDGGAAGIGAPAATVRADDDVPGPEECRVEPRSRESALALLDDPAGPGAAEAISEPATALPAGPPADAATVAAVTATIRERHACENAGDPLRGLALTTDRFLRLVAYAPAGPDASADTLATPPVPHPEEERSRMSRVRDVRVLPDGRVGAVVDGGGAAAWPESGTRHFLIFARVGDRYLVDEALPMAPEAVATPTPLPTPEPPPPGTPVPTTGGVVITMVDPSGATITVSPGACVILTGTQDLPPVCDNQDTGMDWLADADRTKGVVRIDGLLPGAYAVQQRQAPRGYIRGATADVTVVVGELRSVRIVGELAPRLVVSGASASLRAEPFVEAEVVEELPIGTALEATDALAEDDPGDDHPAGWWSVRNPESGARGYVRQDVVAAEGASPGTPTVAADRPVATPSGEADEASVLAPTVAAPTPTAVAAADPIEAPPPRVSPSPTAVLAREIPPATVGAEAAWPVYEEGATVVVGEPRTNLREAPNTASPPIAELPIGTRLRITGPFVVGEDRDWWPVVDVASGRAGYVREDSLVPEEEAPILESPRQARPMPAREAINASPTATATVVPNQPVPTPSGLSESSTVSAPTIAARAATVAVPVPTATAVAIADVSDLPSPTLEAEETDTEAEAARLRAEIAALRVEQAAVAATATAAAAAGEATALEPTAVTATIRVDPDGLLVAEAGAEAAALAALHEALDRYEAGGCRVGFMLISGYGEDVAEGVALARATELLLRREFGGLIADAAAESIAVPGGSPRGQVELRLFVYQGCAPDAAAPAAMPEPIAEPTEAPAPTVVPQG